MARLKSFNPDKIQANRRAAGLNQSAYWSRFGVTQSGGSRYEGGREIPTPTAMLVWLLDTGRLTEKDLEDAKKAVSAAGK